MTIMETNLFLFTKGCCLKHFSSVIRDKRVDEVYNEIQYYKRAGRLAVYEVSKLEKDTFVFSTNRGKLKVYRKSGDTLVSMIN